jgi:uncharacterized protein (DUF2235 family)
MSKNILIFSDGTGQAGGLMPDQSLSNVYKLYRATRCDPLSGIDPNKQLAFYDPGLGSKGDTGGEKLGRFGRRIYNMLAQALGLGITRNIIDCYAAIIRLWRPGDHIYLIGFSRGAYTVRCLGGVLKACGVPTRMKDGKPLKRDLGFTEAIATEAVKQVYQFGASIAGDPYRQDRLELAARFRSAYGSDRQNNAKSNAVPYFIGVWDTVAALGASWSRLFLLAFIGIVLVGALAWGLYGLLLIPWVAAVVPAPLAWQIFVGLLILIVLASLGVYLATHVKFATGLSRPWYKTIHITGWRMRFYDADLDPDVSFARHALSIDENRKDFARVAWTDHGLHVEQPSAGLDWLQQIWFAGNHSDVGGSYAENESRLSDISLGWMTEQLAALPNPILIDRNLLKSWPSSAGPQHDERKAALAAMPGWLVRVLRLFVSAKSIGWEQGLRTVPHDAPLHPSVVERFTVGPVLHFDETIDYRPEPLRNHDAVKQYYGR